MKRADEHLTCSAAGCLAQNLQWRRAATRKTVPTKKAPIAADHRNGTATGKAIQVCLMSVRYDQYPEDREADSFTE
jgi:hypothetical protein